MTQTCTIPLPPVTSPPAFAATATSEHYATQVDSYSAGTIACSGGFSLAPDSCWYCGCGCPQLIPVYLEITTPVGSADTDTGTADFTCEGIGYPGPTYDPGSGTCSEVTPIGPPTDTVTIPIRVIVGCDDGAFTLTVYWAEDSDSPTAWDTRCGPTPFGPGLGITLATSACSPYELAGSLSADQVAAAFGPSCLVGDYSVAGGTCPGEMMMMGPPPTSPPTPPGLVTMAGNLLVSAARHVAAGLPLAPPEVQEARRAKCFGCTAHDHAADRCLDCGCTAMRAKRRGRASDAPGASGGRSRAEQSRGPATPHVPGSASPLWGISARRTGSRGAGGPGSRTGMPERPGNCRCRGASSRFTAP